MTRWVFRAPVAATVGKPGLDARVLVIYEQVGGVGCVDTAGGKEITPPGDHLAFNFEWAHAWHREGSGLWLVLWTFAQNGKIQGKVFSLEPTDGATLVWHRDWTAALPTRSARGISAVRCLEGTGTAWIVVRGDGRVFDALQIFEKPTKVRSAKRIIPPLSRPWTS